MFECFVCMVLIYTDVVDFGYDSDDDFIAFRILSILIYDSDDDFTVFYVYVRFAC